ncbi:MAG: SLBB domain-containing protein [Gammaproteobacteria bacterium]|nr:SLBB domain-containing protein [Gammaproteobacteria bacterium]
MDSLTLAETDSDAYLLSTGDKFRIEVFDEPDLSIDVVLDETGRVSYPLLGEIVVKGKTFRQLEDQITSGLKGRFLVSPKVRVSIVEYRRFFINGEVANPGGYPYIPNITLRKAIALTGGLTERASVDRVFIIRENDPNKKAQKADIDTPVAPGDIVTVYEYREIIISGEVSKPGIYDFQPELTLRKLIALAGGFTPRASEAKIRLIRGKENSKTGIVVPLDYTVLPGDIITVGERFF